MKICLAQINPIKGNIIANIEKHLQLIQAAITKGAEMIIFPELSLTSYEPELAEELATSPTDNRFHVFQKLADTHQLLIGIGVPLKVDQGISISLLLFQPNLSPITYHKKYLHADEAPFFISKDNTIGLIHQKIAFAICYEVFVPQHAIDAAAKKASIYIASVAKSANGVEKAHKRLADIASTHKMTVLMSNCIGPCDNFIGGGKSAVWNKQGRLVGQLDDKVEDILIMDMKKEMFV